VDNLTYLDEEEGQLLPPRKTTLTLVLPTIEIATVAAANIAVAVNAATIAATAEAVATQTIGVTL
jgi:hypothetical protein